MADKTRLVVINNLTDWMAGRTPLCATGPNHRVYSKVSPLAIQSFIRFSPEERNNSAHGSVSFLRRKEDSMRLIASLT